MTQAADVRRWAQQQGIEVAERGRLSIGLATKYELSITGQAANGERRLPFEVLANYLEPRFGNIYDRDGMPIWTKQIYRAVRTFLVRKLPADVWQELAVSAALGMPEDLDARKNLANKLVGQNGLQDLALLVRSAAVVAVPTLLQLYEQLHLVDVWPSEDERWDVAVWLDAHAHVQRLQLMAHQCTHEGQGNYAQWDGNRLTDASSPAEILAVWRGGTLQSQ